MKHDIRCSVRDPLVWLLGVVIMGLTACGQLPKQEVKPRAPVQTIFPLPPDEPRFIYEKTIGNSLDVENAQSDSQFKAILTGERATGGVALQKPYGIAVHKGRIFVSDSVSRIVRVFDVPVGRYFEIGDAEPGRLYKPLGIDVDAAGNLYVADITAKSIMVYDRDGNFMRSLGGPAYFKRLVSVTVDRKAERIYAVDIGGSTAKTEEHRIRVFNTRTGQHLFDFGKRGTGPGEFNLPRDVAIGKDNRLYVVDGGNFRIQVFDADGKYLKSFGKVGLHPGDLGRPKEIQTDASGNVYVIDSTFANLQIFNPDGELLMFIGSRDGEPGPAHFMLPEGVAIDEDGRVYVVDQWFRKIEIFRPATLGSQDGYLGRKLKSTKK